jgi:hypothetical protein
MLSGKERVIRIKSVERFLALSPSSFDSKISETKNTILFSVHPISLTICVAIKNRLSIYKIHSNPLPYPYTLIQEFNITQNVTYLEISLLKIDNNEEQILWYGYASTFFMHRIGQQPSNIILLRDKDPSLQIFRDSSIEILRVIPVAGQLFYLKKKLKNLI